jgi:uncharacterized protein (DUF952 family)
VIGKTRIMTEVPMNRRTIVHIALPEDWEAAQLDDEYTTSTRGVTLAEEEFIHCSHPHQVEAVANAFYGDVDRLVLLLIDIDILESDVVDEPPFPGSTDRFPHIYGPIDLEAVVATTQWHRAPDSAWSLATGT